MFSTSGWHAIALARPFDGRQPGFPLAAKDFPLRDPIPSFFIIHRACTDHHSTWIERILCEDRGAAIGAKLPFHDRAMCGLFVFVGLKRGLAASDLDAL